MEKTREKTNNATLITNAEKIIEKNDAALRMVRERLAELNTNQTPENERGKTEKERETLERAIRNREASSARAGEKIRFAEDEIKELNRKARAGTIPTPAETPTPDDGPFDFSEKLAKLPPKDTGVQNTPTPAPLETIPAPKTSETKTFSTDFIKKRIRSLLESVETVKEIKNIDVKGNNKEIKITLAVRGKKSIITVDIDANVILENSENGIKEKNHHISASKFQDMVEGAIAPKLSKIPELVKSYIEKEEGKKVEKIEIKNGKLKVTFRVPEVQAEKLVTPVVAPVAPQVIPKVPKKTKRTPPIKAETTPAPKTKEAIRLEKKLDDARTKYAEAYKKFIAERKSGLGMFARGKEFVAGARIDDSEIPPELKNLETEYDKATVEYGNMMFVAKHGELSNSSLSDKEKQAELYRYKQNEIFTRVIVEEQSRLNALKAENLPPKEKNLARKILEWYMKQPRWKKLAISTVLGTAIIATFSGSTVAAAGGLTYFAGMRATRALVGSAVGQGAAEAYDWLFKEKSTAKRVEEEKELAKIFEEETFDVSLAKSKKEYAEILEREQKAKRNRLITKAMIGLAAGIGTSIEMGHLLHHVPGQLDTFQAKHIPTETQTPTPVTTHDMISSHVQENIKINPDAVIHKGEGIEHAFRRQIEHNSELAKSLGFKGDINDPKALHQFSGGAAHRLALDKGYVDDTGQEVRITEANKVAFEIKTENGHPVIVEKTTDGKILGTFDDKEGYEFEKNPDNQYEKVVETHHEPVAHRADDVENIRAKLHEQFDDKVETPNPIPAVEHGENLISHTPQSSQFALFAKNPFHLSGTKLIQAFDASQKNLNYLFEKFPKNTWENLKNLKVTAVENTNMYTGDNAREALKFYFHLLEKSANLKPQGFLGIGGEKAQEFIARGLQKLAAGEGKISLEQFEANLRK